MMRNSQILVGVGATLAVGGIIYWIFRAKKTKRGKNYNRVTNRRNMMKVRIPSEHTAFLIGRNGDNIAKIQTTSNTKITVQADDLDPQYQVCIIRGTPEDCEFAESLIERDLVQVQEITTEDLCVPQNMVAFIIGMHGETIKKIAQLTDTKCMCTSSQTADTNQALISIRGKPEQIRAAKQLILEKIQEKQRDARGSGFIDEKPVRKNSNEENVKTVADDNTKPSELTGTSKRYAECSPTTLLDTSTGSTDETRTSNTIPTPDSSSKKRRKITYEACSPERGNSPEPSSKISDDASESGVNKDLPDLNNSFDRDTGNSPLSPRTNFPSVSANSTSTLDGSLNATINSSQEYSFAESSPNSSKIDAPRKSSQMENIHSSPRGDNIGSSSDIKKGDCAVERPRQSNLPNYSENSDARTPPAKNRTNGDQRSEEFSPLKDRSMNLKFDAKNVNLNGDDLLDDSFKEVLSTQRDSSSGTPAKETFSELGKNGGCASPKRGSSPGTSSPDDDYQSAMESIRSDSDVTVSEFLRDSSNASPSSNRSFNSNDGINSKGNKFGGKYGTSDSILWTDSQDYSLSETICEQTYKGFEKSTIESEMEETNNASRKEHESTVVEPNEYWCQRCNMNLLEDGTTLRCTLVYVSCVDNPSRFWVQDILTDEWKEFKEMSEELNSVYKKVEFENTKYFLNYNEVQAGQLVAALYRPDGRWYRGEVERVIRKGPKNQWKVKVLYVDYGDLHTVPIFKIKDLDAKYRAFPFQKKICSLAYVTPNDGVGWKSDAADLFAKLTKAGSEYTMFCRVKAESEDGYPMVVELFTFCPLGKLLNIGQCLIENNLAKEI